jgi:hypothetical protein
MTTATPPYYERDDISSAAKVAGKHADFEILP